MSHLYFDKIPEPLNKVVAKFRNGRIVITTVIDRYYMYVYAEGVGWRQIAEALYGMRSLERYSKAPTIEGKLRHWVKAVCKDRAESRIAEIERLERLLAGHKAELEVYRDRGG